MARPVFTHDIIKKITVAFASTLDEISFLDGHGRERPVPLMFSPREKWLEDLTEKPNMEEFAYDITLPRMGFELTGMNFAPERHTNPLHRIVNSGAFSYNRVPYDFAFTVYLATTRINDGNRIIEQIIPYYTPELMTTVKDIEELDTETNIAIVLNSVSSVAEYEGTFDNHRILTWEMQFTVKAFLYQDVKTRDVIKKTITDLRSQDFDLIYERLISRVDPPEAFEEDEHEIIDEVEFPDGEQ